MSITKGKDWILTVTTSDNTRCSEIAFGELITQAAINNIKEAEIALITFGESMQHVGFPFKNIPLESLDRRYVAHDIKPDPTPVKNKPWYQDHKNYRSKKTRRKL